MNSNRSQISSGVRINLFFSELNSRDMSSQDLEFTSDFDSNRHQDNQKDGRNQEYETGSGKWYTQPGNDQSKNGYGLTKCQQYDVNLAPFLQYLGKGIPFLYQAGRIVNGFSHR